jgi:transposase
MPKPYSQDLRRRVVRHVEAGHLRRAEAAHFGVSVSFVVNLMTAYRLGGSLAPKPLGGRRHAKLDPHRLFLLRRVAEKDDITMPELAEELEAACGAKAAPASISRWFIRNGYRFKKTLLASECDRPDIPQAREQWRAERQPKMRLEPHKLVFLDETGTTTK